MTSNAQIEHAAAAWLARRESEWSDVEQAEFQAWLEASVAHRVAWIRLQAGWKRAARLKALAAGCPPGSVPPPGAWPELPGADGAQGATPIAPDLRGIKFRARPVVRHSRMQGWPAAATALLLLVACVSGWWRFGSLERASYATALGETRQVRLGDGSVILLSSGTRVDVAYFRHRRDLKLVRGEAFFEVAPDHDRPFAVSAGARRVVAVGTRFAVRHDPASLRVAVTQGRVRLEDKAQRSATPTLLDAGMVAVADADGVRLHRRSGGDMEDMLSWRDGVLVFRSTPLTEAIAEFNRYNVHKLILDDPSIGAARVGGSFRWSNSDAFVRVLEQEFDIRAAQQGDGIHLRAR